MTFVVYQETVTSTVKNNRQKQETYVGLTEGTFKTWFKNYTHAFTKSKIRSSTELSNCIWTPKDNNFVYAITWKVLSQTSDCKIDVTQFCHHFSARKSQLKKIGVS